MDLQQVDAQLKNVEKSLERERGVIQALASKGQLAATQAAEAHDTASACEEASRLLAQFADEKQTQVVEIIQNIASVGLTQIFDEPIELHIEQVVRARRVEMDVKIKTGELETSIMDARGGGVAAVAGFLLRVSVLLLTPNARKLMVLDEVFAHLSEDYVPRLAEFLRELCETTGLQLILVTHQPEFTDAAHKVIRIERVNQNTSRFVEENNA